MGLGADEMGTVLCMNELYFRFERHMQLFSSLEDLNNTDLNRIGRLPPHYHEGPTPGSSLGSNR